MRLRIWDSVMCWLLVYSWDRASDSGAEKLEIRVISAHFRPFGANRTGEQRGTWGCARYFREVVAVARFSVADFSEICEVVCGGGQDVCWAGFHVLPPQEIWAKEDALG